MKLLYENSALNFIGVIISRCIKTFKNNLIKTERKPYGSFIDTFQ